MNYFIIFLVVAGGGYFIYWIIKFSNTPLSEEAKKEFAKERANKIKTYFTVEFVLPKRINNEDIVKPYAVPNSNKVNFYENNSFGGEGFLHKEFNKNLWKIVDANRDISATIQRTQKNKGEIKLIYK